MAFKYYKNAADLGNSFGLAKLGLCYEMGVGTNQDAKLAFSYYEKSAKVNNS